MMDRGLLPNLESMIRVGVMGNLATLDPPFSPMLWTSIATGKRPYKHGVLGFFEPSEATDSGIRPVLGTSRSCKAIWNILSESGYNTHVVGWWPSHPVESVNGIMISDLYPRSVGRLYEAWPLAPNSVYPNSESKCFADLRIHPEELTGNHLLPFVPDAAKVDQEMDPRLYTVARESAQAATLHAAFTHILRTREWDFAALYLSALDHYCHGFMKYHPPRRSHIPKPDYDLYHNVVTTAYIFHDMMLGRILRLAGPETSVLLISDHGFRSDHLRPRDIPNEPAGPAYEHSPYGIFVMKGPGICQDKVVYGASLLDMTPTVLHALNLPVGADMDGKVLNQVFTDTRAIDTIESWEAVNEPYSNSTVSVEEYEANDTQALQQLIDLGYIHPPGPNAEMNRQQATDEWQLNLARAYIDGGLTEKAIPVLEDLYDRKANEARIAIRLASAYQAMGELKKSRAIIETMKAEDVLDEATRCVLEGSLLLGERRPTEAIRYFKQAEKLQNDGANSTSLHLQIAHGYTLLGNLAAAKNTLLTEIDRNPTNARAHANLGSVYLRDKRFDEAIQSLLHAVGLEYEMPQAHFELGLALYSLGEYTKAADAMEVCLIMAPKANRVRKHLIRIYKQHLNDVDKANAHTNQFDAQTLGTIVVVSGLPRSGTSLMMQMLADGGLPPFTDHVREADDNNPKGYFEHEAVKNLAKSQEFLKGAVDRSVKVVAHLLKYLPARFRYKIIFMERDLEEIIDSQQAMLVRLGKKMRTEVYPLRLVQQYEHTTANVKQWASRHPNVEILYVSYANVIEHPFEEALRIHEFLDYRLLPEQMATSVDPQLYRSKRRLVRPE